MATSGMDGALDEAPVLHHVRRPRAAARGQHRRSLGSNDGDFESILVDRNGNEYDPYSLAWRYLGLYIDCDVDYVNGGNGGGGDGGGNDHNRARGRRRRLSEDDDDGEECGRKVLWAAYRDPRYSGNVIEEYEFLSDIVNGTWDDSACLASGRRHRCARMDCHEPRTHFKLVGVFKETDGMYDFTEQLFKHEGYCVWGDDEDTYETMETWMEKWPTSCIQLNNPDYDGSTLYFNVHPQPEGNMTLEIYNNEQCTQISPYTNLTSYIQTMYYNYYGSYDKGNEVAEMYEEAIATWNEKMSTFKVCQPCRAYNLFAEGGSDHSGDDGNHRLLGSGDDSDGDGEEQERYNCYDDAGYTNVNQCYKFETHTSLEVAESEDLALASAQGTILRVKGLDGKIYGEGGYTSLMSAAQKKVYISFAAAAAISLAVIVFFFHKTLEGSRRRAARKSLKENFIDPDADETATHSTMASAAERNSGEYRGIELGDVLSNPSHKSGDVRNITDMHQEIFGPVSSDDALLIDLGLVTKSQRKVMQSSPGRSHQENAASITSSGIPHNIENSHESNTFMDGETTTITRNSNQSSIREDQTTESSTDTHHGCTIDHNEASDCGFAEASHTDSVAAGSTTVIFDPVGTDANKSSLSTQEIAQANSTYSGFKKEESVDNGVDNGLPSEEKVEAARETGARMEADASKMSTNASAESAFRDDSGYTTSNPQSIGAQASGDAQVSTSFDNSIACDDANRQIAENIHPEVKSGSIPVTQTRNKADTVVDSDTATGKKTTSTSDEIPQADTANSFIGDIAMGKSESSSICNDCDEDNSTEEQTAEIIESDSAIHVDKAEFC